MNISAEEVRAFLTQRQVQFEEREIQYGRQFRCKPGGEIFNVYDRGTLSFQGKSQTELAIAIRDLAGLPTPTADEQSETADAGPRPTPEPRASISNKVFIVYGHDLAVRDQLELLLRRMKLEPIVLENLAAGGDTIIEKLETYLGKSSNVGFACVLLTPDDRGALVGATELNYRARQNVILELGMVLANLGRARVAILYKESVELPSDISGLIYIPFKERIDEVKTKLFRELKTAGYQPASEGL